MDIIGGIRDVRQTLFVNLKLRPSGAATLDRRRISWMFLVLAVAFFVADLLIPGSSFLGLGLAGELLYWLLFVTSLLFIVLFAAFRGRSY